MPDLTHDDLPRIAAFVARWSGHGLTQRAAALREACLSGHGTWIEPDADAPWPAHSCHACSLMHLWADGDTPEELARNWFTAAQRLLIEIRPDDTPPVERAA
jgi:hypothetical protein